jgi:hypothetical protein
VGLTGLLAVVRARREEPGLGYMLMGLAGFAAMNYSMENAMQAVRHAAQHLRAGDVAPALRRHA